MGRKWRDHRFDLATCPCSPYHDLIMATSPQSGAPQSSVAQSERVTFLTSRQQKAALDAFAASRGESVGNVVREATARYMAQSNTSADDSAVEQELAAIVAELVSAVPVMKASLERSARMLHESADEVDRMMRDAGIRK